MTLERQIVEIPENQISTKRGFPVYRTNPSVPQAFNGCRRGRSGSTCRAAKGRSSWTTPPAS
jgi:hypothetical protein